jgi:hypothetical protein
MLPLFIEKTIKSRNLKMQENNILRSRRRLARRRIGAAAQACRAPAFSEELRFRPARDFAGPPASPPDSTQKRFPLLAPMF